MQKKELRSYLLLLLASALWGFGFIAQKLGGENLGPFSFNALRFLLGSLSLLPILLLNKKRTKGEKLFGNNMKLDLTGGMIAGVFIFLGAWLQQYGLMYTTAAKGAFLTGFYLVLVPIIGTFLHQKAPKNIWVACLIAIIGIYYLTMANESSSISINKADVIILIGSIFWAGHIYVIDYYTKLVNPIRLSFFQFLASSLFSFIMVFFTETISFSNIKLSFAPLLYSGLVSVGIAFTLQIVGQKHAKPSLAAIILSLETVFATIGGAILLKDKMGFNGYLGCALMLVAMILAQLNFDKFKITDLIKRRN